MPVLQAVAAVIEKSAATAVEGAGKYAAEVRPLSENGFKEFSLRHTEHLEGRIDAVFSKLDEIRGLTPEQLRDKLDEAMESHSREGVTEAADPTEAESAETRELTDEEINEKQKSEIRSALTRLENGEQLSDKEVGNLCEMMMDQYYIGQGYRPLHERVVSLDDPIHQGLDGVYEKDGSFVIVDAKYNRAQLHETQDGRQMSENWIDRRLDDAVGKEKADEIRDAMEDDPSRVSAEVYHYDPHPDLDGNTHSDVYHVDENGYKCGESVTVETYQHGEPVAGPHKPVELR